MSVIATSGRSKAWFLPVALVVLIVACGGQVSLTDASSAVCNRALQLDHDVLLEILDVDEIRQELDLLEAELAEAGGLEKEAGTKFLRAAREIMAGGFYDYPTFQVLNYLDTYEHMGLHVAAFEAVEELREAGSRPVAESG